MCAQDSPPARATKYWMVNETSWLHIPPANYKRFLATLIRLVTSLRRDREGSTLYWVGILLHLSLINM